MEAQLWSLASVPSLVTLPPTPCGLVEAIATQILCAICPPLRSISLNLTATLGSVPGLFSFFLS